MIIVSLRRAITPVAAVLALAGILVGCGSSASSSSGTAAAAASTSSSVPQSTAPPTETSTTSSTAASGVSYSAANVPISAGGFTFNLSVKLTVGTPSTNTDNEQPPYVNVAAPLSRSATLTNTTANYTADPKNQPLIGVFALYPLRSAICHYGLFPATFHPGPAGLCGLDIAELVVACHVDNPGLSLATGQGATLVPCNINNYQAPNSVQLIRLTSDTAQALIAQLSNPPNYWVLLNESGAADPATGSGFACQSDEYYIQGGQFIGQVISSKPDGVTGCLGR